MVLEISDVDRIRTITLNRPDALNAFNEALYDATTDALLDAADDNAVAVVIITGTGRSFSAGTDVVEMAMRNTGGVENGRHGFPGLVDNLVDFPKPLICAVNGMALGIGATMLALSDLVFMSTEARVRCPFTALAVAPEAASSYTFPAMIGRHNATWALMSSEWLSAQECLEMGITWKVCEPDVLMEETMKHARVLASKSISSLVESKKTIMAAIKPQIDAARERENAAFAYLMGRPANMEAMVALAERRQPDFAAIDLVDFAPNF
ncbi:MAG: enoyl-CoA hydratase/isomerase family protein [Actinobacteria bacterium]|nr:enoyl-CoA hydratase/isomerase family protein [Actinomycetota bacterium]MSX34374.1 enoyl-CoA hydratase/isomerase family protein [Actinomycetota bacterium]MSX95633.1 enoyl-CoA hydratase/isomerase family protein [Actinomycetota bacterium]MSY25632.1 enoyl-CoA hydratase/isomerase family protein [Actinomycetota bacterium]MSZ52644.1 enoyl-CoA hydratase/isomerase family protein [Actinomycetota bacterium]